MRKLLLATLLFTSTCLGQVSLRQYVGFTDTQAVSIQKLNQDYNDVWFAQQDRVNSLNNELRALLATNAPDPAELGRRAVELELIRRDRVARQTVLQQQIAVQLTPTETAALQNVIAAAMLQPLLNDATCANLLAARYYSRANATIGFPGNINPASSLPALRIPPAPTGSFCGSEIFPFSVRQFLALTDAQVAVFFSASATYNDFYARQQNRLTDIQLAIQDLTATPGTDPIALGLLYVEMAQIGQQITAKSTQLRDATLSLLTAPQTAQVNSLQAAQNILDNNFVNIALGCNLLTMPAGTTNYASTPTGQNSFCLL